MLIRPIPWTAELYRRLDACEPFWCIMRWALLDAENNQAWFCGPLHRDGYGFERDGILLALFDDVIHARAFLAQSSSGGESSSARDYPLPLSALRFDVQDSRHNTWSSGVEYVTALRDVARARLLDANKHLPSQIELAKSIKLRWSIEELTDLFGRPDQLARPGPLSLLLPESRDHNQEP